MQKARTATSLVLSLYTLHSCSSRPHFRHMTTNRYDSPTSWSNCSGQRRSSQAIIPQHPLAISCYLRSHFPWHAVSTRLGSRRRQLSPSPCCAESSSQAHRSRNFPSRRCMQFLFRKAALLRGFPRHSSPHYCLPRVRFRNSSFESCATALACVLQLSLSSAPPIVFLVSYVELAYDVRHKTVNAAGKFRKSTPHNSITTPSEHFQGSIK
jgi:hypothetical protein